MKTLSPNASNLLAGLALLVSSSLLSVNAQAIIVESSIVQSWTLTNKTPGALGLDYGLRLNNLDPQGIMIFDFEHIGSDMTMDLVDLGDGDYELHLYGTAFGAEFVSSPKSFGETYAGYYDIEFVWQDVELNAGGFDFIAEQGIDFHAMGSSSGTVTGLGENTAFQEGLSLVTYSGGFNHTLDGLYGRNPEIESWLSYGDGRHAGDFSFSLEPTAVPLPGAFSLMASAISLIMIRRKIA